MATKDVVDVDEKSGIPADVAADRRHAQAEFGNVGFTNNGFSPLLHETSGLGSRLHIQRRSVRHWLADRRIPHAMSGRRGQSTSGAPGRSAHGEKSLQCVRLGATPCGIFGAHHFYLDRCVFGVYYLLTGGGFGIGWIVDWFRMPVLVKRANNPDRQLLGTRHKFVDDAYVMAFPAGFLGLHHFYLERPGWGVLYLFTGGLFGIGWLVDLCRMPCLVAEANRRLEDDVMALQQVRQQMGVACVVTNRSNVVVCPGYDAYGQPVYPRLQQQQQQQPAVVGVMDPSMMPVYNGSAQPTTAVSSYPPPYAEMSAAAPVPSPGSENTGLQQQQQQPPAYSRYGSMNDAEKKY